MHKINKNILYKNYWFDRISYKNDLLTKKENKTANNLRKIKQEIKQEI